MRPSDSGPRRPSALLESCVQSAESVRDSAREGSEGCQQSSCSGSGSLRRTERGQPGPSVHPQSRSPAAVACRRQLRHVGCPGLQHLCRPPGRGNQTRQLVPLAELSLICVKPLHLRAIQPCQVSKMALEPRNAPEALRGACAATMRAACLALDLTFACFLPRI